MQGPVTGSVRIIVDSRFAARNRSLQVGRNCMDSEPPHANAYYLQGRPISCRSVVNSEEQGSFQTFESVNRVTRRLACRIWPIEACRMDTQPTKGASDLRREIHSDFPKVESIMETMSNMLHVDFPPVWSRRLWRMKSRII